MIQFTLVNRSWNYLCRQLHRWGSLVIALPLLVVISTGILLLLKKDLHWIQPSTQTGEAKIPRISFEQMLASARQVSDAQIESWKDVDRVDVQPRRGIAKLLSRNRWEVQIDLHSGAVLQHAYRRSDLIESLHDGSWFHESAKYWIFLPAGLITLGLWLTGMYLFVLPYTVTWRRARKHRQVKR